MDIYIGITLLVLLPICFLVIIFICSLRSNWRKEFDKYFGFGKIPIEERLGRIETLLEEQQRKNGKAKPHRTENKPNSKRKRKRRKIRTREKAN